MPNTGYVLYNLFHIYISAKLKILVSNQTVGKIVFKKLLRNIFFFNNKIKYDFLLLNFVIFLKNFVNNIFLNYIYFYYTAKYILSGMNKSVDPCDDFHGYVCGSWSTNYPIPADWYAWSLWEMAKQKIRIFLKGLYFNQYTMIIIYRKKRCFKNFNYERCLYIL